MAPSSLPACTFWEALRWGVGQVRAVRTQLPLITKRRCRCRRHLGLHFAPQMQLKSTQISKGQFTLVSNSIRPFPPHVAVRYPLSFALCHLKCLSIIIDVCVCVCRHAMYVCEVATTRNGAGQHLSPLSLYWPLVNCNLIRLNGN